MRSVQPSVSWMPITGSSMLGCVCTRTRAVSAPVISTRARTSDGGTRRSPVVTSALTHSGVRRSPGSSRTWTAKSSGWPRTALAPPVPRPAAETTVAANAATATIDKASHGRFVCIK